jgi:hypothetical protein
MRNLAAAAGIMIALLAPSLKADETQKILKAAEEVCKSDPVTCQKRICFHRDHGQGDAALIVLKKYLQDKTLAASMTGPKQKQFGFCKDGWPPAPDSDDSAALVGNTISDDLWTKYRAKADAFKPVAPKIAAPKKEDSIEMKSVIGDCLQDVGCWKKRICIHHLAKQDKAADEVLKRFLKEKALGGSLKDPKMKSGFCKDGWPQPPAEEAPEEVAAHDVALPKDVSPTERSLKGGDCKGTIDSRERLGKLEKLEDFPKYCLNEPCYQAAAGGWDACPALARLGLDEFSSQPVVSTMSYLDAEGVVFLTRAKLTDYMLKNFETMTGTRMSSDEFPKECTDNKELADGMNSEARDEPPKSLLKDRMTRIRQDALLIKSINDKLKSLGLGARSVDGHLTAQPYIQARGAISNLLLRSPELLPPGYKGPEDVGGDIDADITVALGLADVVNKGGGDDEQFKFMRGNVAKQVQMGLKEACGMKWKDLLRLPFASKFAHDIAFKTTVIDKDQKPPVSRIFECLDGAAKAASAKDVAADACWAVLTGVSIGMVCTGMELPALAAHAGAAACTATSAGIHFMDLRDAWAGQRLNNACVLSTGKACDEKTKAKLDADVNGAIAGIAIDLVTVPASAVVGTVVNKLLSTGVKTTVAGAKWLTGRLTALRAAMAAGDKAAMEVEAHAIEAALEGAGTKVIVGEGELVTAEELAAKTLARRESLALAAAKSNAAFAEEMASKYGLGDDAAMKERLLKIAKGASARRAAAGGEKMTLEQELDFIEAVFSGCAL